MPQAPAEAVVTVSAAVSPAPISPAPTTPPPTVVPDDASERSSVKSEPNGSALSVRSDPAALVAEITRLIAQKKMAQDNVKTLQAVQKRSLTVIADIESKVRTEWSKLVMKVDIFPVLLPPPSFLKCGVIKHGEGEQPIKQNRGVYGIRFWTSLS